MYKNLFFIIILFHALLFSPPYAEAQEISNSYPFYVPDARQRLADSLLAASIPLLEIPEGSLKATLPDSVDNSSYPWFAGILNQHSYMACQQYCGPGYTFAYEINRLREADGTLPENRYSPHYTWNFFNKGTNEGVNFLHSFHAMMSQGHMTSDDYGADTAQFFTGWIDGYDKYYRAMHNRIRNTYAIPINSAEGIQTVKQYLYDHLDGSQSGGVVCFTASSPSMLSAATILPPGTPEEGKYVITNWLPYPSHGMTLIGYHDSIRYDINEDGQFTNNLDINGDNTVDVMDWEIGGFRIANSYGNWWQDGGFCYVLYSAMAKPFEEGGIWNHRVYVVEPDPDYEPLLTARIDLEYNLRDHIRILAGVHRDPNAQVPGHIIEIPLFNYQGGPMWMQGFDTIPQQKRLEFGIDITPLASYFNPDEPVRLFLLIEEDDSSNVGNGILHEASFLWYGTSVQEFICPDAGIPIQQNGHTMVSAPVTISFTAPEITTNELPQATPGIPYTVQFSAQQGVEPYSWYLRQPYSRSGSAIPYTAITDNLLEPQTDDIPYAKVPLPFSFPFYGTYYDTAFVNLYGMVHFTENHIPYPYLMSAEDMLKHIDAIVPAFSKGYVLRTQDGDGMWMKACADSVIFRWKVSLLGMEGQTNLEFNCILYPDGSVVTAYGPISVGEVPFMLWHGITRGDDLNLDIEPIYPVAPVAGSAYLYLPPFIPEVIAMTSTGLCTISGIDSSLIYDLTVGVTDDQGISREKTFQLTNGLMIEHRLTSSGGICQYGEPVSVDIKLTNTGISTLSNLEILFACTVNGLLISDSLEQLGSLDPGASQWIENAFRFEITEVVPDGYAFPCTLTASKTGQSWHRAFNIEVAAPDIQVNKPSVEDGVNHLLDLGETADLVISVTNDGSLGVKDMEISLQTSDTLIAILSNPEIMVEELGTKGSVNLHFLVRASRWVDPGGLAEMVLTLSDGSTVDITYPFSLEIGATSIALVKLEETTPSFNLMTQLMDSVGISYTVFNSIPDNLSNYPAAFFLLGTSYNGSYALSTTETLQLISYMTKGGNAYMESYSSWHYGTAPMLEDLFRFTSDRVSVYYFNEVYGTTGSFAEGMDFIYPGPSPFAIFEVYPREDAFTILENEDDTAKCLAFGYDGPAYKSIGTFVEFGYLNDGTPPSTKADLFLEYINFFNINYQGPYPYFHADTTHICPFHPIQFTDDSFDNITSWSWEFPGGIPAWSEEQHPVVSYNDPGMYDVILTVSDGLHSQTMHKKDYIHILGCTGVPPSESAPRSLSIWPNPASAEAIVRIPETFKGKFQLEALDLQGRICFQSEMTAADIPNQVKIPTLAWPSGIYTIRVTSNQTTLFGKLVVIR